MLLTSLLGTRFRECIFLIRKGIVIYVSYTSSIVNLKKKRFYLTHTSRYCLSLPTGYCLALPMQDKMSSRAVQGYVCNEYFVVTGIIFLFAIIYPTLTSLHIASHPAPSYPSTSTVILFRSPRLRKSFSS
jgi:hypothetical protein